jgi:hypothetical protein
VSRWPVVTPPKGKLHVNLTGGAPKAEFDGPLNVLIALQATAQAAVLIDKTKQEYDDIGKPQMATGLRKIET